MQVPTGQTQRKIAELLHAMTDCQNMDGVHVLDECSKKDEYVVNSAFFLGRLMPAISAEMFPAVRADERDRVAYHITAELVCCDIHARLEAEASKGHWDDQKHTYVMPKSWYDLKKSHDYHDICHYGGWAASLAYHPWDGTTHEGWWKPWELDPKPAKE
jgi:hypothetical protein